MRIKLLIGLTLVIVSLLLLFTTSFLKFIQNKNTIITTPEGMTIEKLGSDYIDYKGNLVKSYSINYSGENYGVTQTLYGSAETAIGNFTHTINYGIDFGPNRYYNYTVLNTSDDYIAFVCLTCVNREFFENGSSVNVSPPYDYYRLLFVNDKYVIEFDNLCYYYYNPLFPDLSKLQKTIYCDVNKINEVQQKMNRMFDASRLFIANIKLLQ